MDDERLEELASALGRGAEDAVDLEGVARVVVGRLAEERRRPTRPLWRRAPLLRAAALVGLLIVGSLVIRGIGPDDVSSLEFAGPVALEELSTADLDEVLDSLTYDGPVSDLFAASLDDLDESQLRELLASLEG